MSNKKNNPGPDSEVKERRVRRRGQPPRRPLHLPRSPEQRRLQLPGQATPEVESQNPITKLKQKQLTKTKKKQKQLNNCKTNFESHYRARFPTALEACSPRGRSLQGAKDLPQAKARAAPAGSQDPRLPKTPEGYVGFKRECADPASGYLERRAVEEIRPVEVPHSLLPAHHSHWRTLGFLPRSPEITHLT